MRKKLYAKQMVAASLAAAMVVTSIPVNVRAEEVPDSMDRKMIANFTFDGETPLAGEGAAAVLMRDYTLVDMDDGGKALSLSSSTKDWLNVTKADGSPLLAGKENITISYDSRDDADSANRGWAVFAAPNTNEQKYQQEHYLGIIDKQASLGVERYNNNGKRPGNINVKISGEWKHVDLVVTETETILYVNGVETARQESAYKLSDILGADGGVLQIGKGNWEKGEYYSGLLDNFKIYDGALTEEQITDTSKAADVGLLADFTFDDYETGFTGGEASAAGALLTDHGSEAQDMALSLDGGRSRTWLNITRDDDTALLKDLEEVTISYDSKAGTTGNGWALFAAESGEAQKPNYEKYLGVIDKTDSMKIERFYNEGTRPVNDVLGTSSAEWKHVDLVIQESATTLYVDGVKSENTSDFKLSDILGADGGVLQIGKANWGSGEYFGGQIDNIQIYNYARTEDEIKDQVTVVYKSGSNGTLQGVTEEKVKRGGSTSGVEAVADEGYHFKQWSDGVTDAVRIDENVTESFEVTAAFEKDEEIADENLIATFTFDDEENGFAGAGAKATVNGTPVLEDSYDNAGKAMSISSANWFSIAKEDETPLLKGLDEVTISYDSKASGSGNGWAFYAAPNLNAQVGTPANEHYLGIMDKASGLMVERYNNTGKRPGNNISAGSSSEWKHVDLVVTESTSTLYVNGEKVGDHTSTYKLSDILGESGGIIQIGKANWGSGEYYQGLIDNVKIYNTAKSPEFIKENTTIKDPEPVKPVAPDVVEDGGLLAQYDMSAIEDGNLKDVSGLGNDAAAVGMTQENILVVEDVPALSFTGNKSQYIELPMMEGVMDEEFTIETTVSSLSGAYHWLWCLGSKVKGTGSNYLYVDPCYSNGYVRGGIKGETEERIFGGCHSLPKDGSYGTITITYKDKVLSYYLDGAIITTFKFDTSVKEILENGTENNVMGYIGRSLWSADPGLKAKVADFKIYDKALTEEQISGTASRDDSAKVAAAKEALDIPNADDVRGNITLQDELEGVALTWSSSKEEVITSKAQSQGDTVTPAGVVTRGAEDQKVTLTAQITSGNVTDSKTFELTVKKSVEQDPYVAYLFGSFTGTEGKDTDEQIYFASSKDGYFYTDLNDSKPILTSTVGEKGVRDPFIMRSAEGDRFYMLATDLSIYHRGGWGGAMATTTGSRDLIIWESTDLVNWSEPRAVTVSSPTGGCAWAPEAIYDETTGEYVVYWATNDMTDEIGDGVLQIYYAKTRDFVTFTEAKEYITRGADQSIIDTTMIKGNDGYYYRASADGQITLERSTSIFGNWEVVTNLNSLGLGGDMTGKKLEGPELFKFNDGTTFGLYTDQFAEGKGYLPVITTDLSDTTGTAWKKLASDEYSFDTLKKRHGTILNLTQKEYDAVMKAYGKAEAEDDEDAAVTEPFAYYPLTNDLKDGTENGFDAALTGEAEFAVKDKGGIVFPSGTATAGKNYLKLDDGILTKLQDAKELTVTAWVRNDVTNTNSNDRSTVFAFGSDEKNGYAFSTLNWASARTTFMLNGKEAGGAWGDKDSTSILGDTPGNQKSPLGSWYQIAMTIRDVTGADGTPATTLKYYMNGELLCTATTPASISSLGTLTYAYIGTGNNDSYKDFQGGIREVKFVESILSGKQIKEKYEQEDAQYQKTDAEIVAEVKESLTIPNADAVLGNVTLPTEKDGTKISWTSSDEQTVSAKETVNENYDNTPAGVVARGEKDKNVVLTAVISKGEAQDTKEITVTVKAKSNITEDDFEAYVFAYFKGEGSATGEQIYFATSEDGLHWKDMNDGEPVLQSELGEKGLRDPFIIRSPEGDKFYLIATDLKINGGNGWGAAQTAGSQSIMVWESTDMVNWSNQRMAKVALDDAGCTWAPEAFYDEKTGEYIVFWASKTSADNYGVQRVYYSKTRDFYSFTEPELWIELENTEGNAISVIDTSVISVMENGKNVYYRFSKNEAGEDHDVKGGNGKYTIVEKSDSLLGGWTEVTSLKDQRYVEGGTCFKFNGEDKWCLLLDDFGGVGYYPMITTDLGSGEFTRLDSSKYSFPSTMRHGTVMSLTRQEYDAIQKKWNDEAAENTEAEEENAVLKYSFEDVTGSDIIKDDSGKGRNGKIYGNAAYVEDQEKGNVLYLNGTNGTYAELPQGFFDGRNKMTISMDVKAEMVDGSYFTFGIGKNSNRYLFLKTQNTQSRVSLTTGSYGSEQTASGTTSAIKGKWMNITMVVTPEKIVIYKDGKLLGEQKVTVKMTELGTNLFAYLGKSFYSGDNYFKGYFDNIEVYNRAMEAAEVADKYGAKPETEKFTITYKAGEHGKITGTASQTLEKGTLGTKVEAVADPGYEFSKWSDGSTQAARTDLAEKDVTYTAYFEKTQVTPPTDEPETETPPTEKPSEPSTEKPSQPSTEKPSQPSTEKPSQPSTEKPAKPVAKSVKINKKKITIGLKEKVTLKATVYPKGASQKVTWSSSKKSVVKVNSKGQIEGKKTGKATITVKTANKKTYKCTVTVRKAPSKISLNTYEKKLKAGKSFQIKVNLPSKTASYQIQYSSNRKSVAVVSSTGKITAKKKGTATIKVKAFNGKYKTIKIKVVKK